MEKISFNFADHVITINEPIQDLLISRGLPRVKSTVITNSAEDARFASPSVLSACEESKEQFVMMYHGTLTSIYGLDIAIEAFALASNEMPKAELWILGDGTEKNALSKLAHDRGLGSRVRLIGQVPPSEIPTWLNQCDVGVLPIRSDVFLEFASPNKLPEYIVMGKAVLISRLRAIRYYFSEDALAFFEPNNASALAEEMVRLYRDPELRVQLAARAEEEYAPICWHVMKERYLRLIEEMVGPARGTVVPTHLAATVGAPK